MSIPLGGELLKLRTLLLPRLMLVLAALSTGLISFAVIQTDDVAAAAPADAMATAAARPLWFLAVVVAVLATAGEFQHRTIHATLMQVPRRGQLFVAKTVVAAGYGAAITLVGVVCSVGMGLVSQEINGTAPPGSIDLHLLTTIAASVTIGAVWAVMAAGLGMLARNTAIALVALLLWRFVLEGILPMVTRQPNLPRWLPSGTADALLSGSTDLLAPWAGGLLFAGYAAVVTLAAALLFTRTDP